MSGVGRRHALLVPARRRPAASRSRFAVSAGWPARPLGDRRSARRSAGPIATGPASTATVRCSTRCTSARSRPKAPGRRLPTNCRRSPISASPSIEMMPVADFAGRFGWGYDGVEPVRADAAVRHAGRPARVRRSRARARHRRHPRRRLQPSRARTGITCAEFSPRLLHRPLHERLGRGDQLRGRRRPRARTSSRTPATGSTSSTSTACGSTRRRTSRTPRRNTSSPTIVAPARASGRRAAPIYVVAENEPQDTRLVAACRRRAATASMRCGTTTITTPRSSR